jgi:hypothetical protein
MVFVLMGLFFGNYVSAVIRNNGFPDRCRDSDVPIIKRPNAKITEKKTLQFFQALLEGIA